MMDDRRRQEAIDFEDDWLTDRHDARPLVVDDWRLSYLVGRLADPQAVGFAASETLPDAEDAEACTFAVDSCGLALIDMLGLRRGAVLARQLTMLPADARDGAP